MKLYPLFVLVASVTVLIPGPGVVMTLTNSVRYGMRGSFGGILGIAAGAFVVAAISSSSLGLLLATSSLAFSALRFIGGAYLIYLGIRFWRSPPFRLVDQPAHRATFGKRFVEGLSLQLTNPKAIFFFLSVLPQFIEPDASYAVQFSALVCTYSALVVLVHSVYAMGAQRARRWLGSESGGKMIRRLGGASFAFFGGALLTAKQ